MICYIEFEVEFISFLFKNHSRVIIKYVFNLVLFLMINQLELKIFSINFLLEFEI